MKSNHKLSIPFANLNLKCNPFGNLSPEERGELAVVTVEIEKFVPRLQKPGFAVLFLGDSGRGKSTHLFALRIHFPEAPYIYFPPKKPLPSIPKAPLLFLDEAQRIPRGKRRELFGRPASFVLGSHKNHSRELKKAGLEYCVVRLQGVPMDLLQRIIKNRIEWARRDPGQPIPEVSRALISHLIDRFGSDLWAIEDYLYDHFQELDHLD